MQIYQVLILPNMCINQGKSASVSKKGHIMPKKRYYDKMREDKDGAMVSGPVGIALMPTNVIQKYYPSDGSYMVENLNDGLSGVDKQKKSDVGGAKKNPSQSKY